MIGFVKTKDCLVKIYEDGNDYRVISDLKTKQTYHTISSFRTKRENIELAINNHLKYNKRSKINWNDFTLC